MLSFRNLLLTVAILGMGSLLILPLPAADTATPAEIKKLVDQLGSSEFEEREEASKKLDAIGVPALELLRKAVTSDDAEVKQRAGDLVAKLEKQAESAAILAPKRVHLVYKDTPLTEALKDFSKKSGYSIGVIDPQNKLKDRTITLDTGEVAFWEAMEQFTQKANLVDASFEDLIKLRQAPQPMGGAPGLFAPPPVPAPPVRVRPIGVPLPPPPANAPGATPQPLPGGKPDAAPKEKPREEQPKQDQPKQIDAPPPAPRQAVMLVRPARPIAPVPPNGVVQINQAWAVGGPQGFSVPAANQITLIDGKAKPVPADLRGAIRIKEAADFAKNHGKTAENELRFGLQLTAEPKLTLQQITSVRVEKAVDDQDQKLTQWVQMNPGAGAVGVGGFPGAPAVIMAPVGGFGGGFGGMPGMGGQMAGPGSQSTVFSLKKGEKAAKTLKEVTGVVTAQVLKPIQPAITVDEILKAKGKEFKGKDGGLIKVSEVSKAENGQTTVRFEFVAPGNGGGNAGFGMIQGGVRIMAAPVPLAPPPPPPPAPKPQGALPIKRKELAVQAQPGQAQPGQAQPPEVQAQNARAEARENQAKQLEAQQVQLKAQQAENERARAQAQELWAKLAVAQAQQARVQVQQAQALPAMQIAPPPVQIQIGGPVFIGGIGFNGNDNGFSLIDSKGVAVKPVQLQQQAQRVGNQFKIEQVLVFPKMENEPAKMIYSVQQSVSIEIPFTLKNVQIP